MSALPSPIPPTTPPVKHSPIEHKRRWYLELLETCRELAGLPTMVSLTLAVFFPDNKPVLEIGTGLAVAVAIILRLFPSLRHVLKPHRGHAFWSALPWLLTAILVAVLIWKVIPDHSIQQNNFFTTSWLEWQRKLDDAAGQCKNDGFIEVMWSRISGNQADKNSNEAARDKCLKENLSSVLTDRPRPKQESDSTGLVTDLIAGQVLLNNEVTNAALGERLSIRDKFLGSGRSEPVGGTDYKDASVSEYLAPNLPEQSPNVWSWQLERWPAGETPVMDRNLLQLLRANKTFESSWESIKVHLQPGDKRPLMVRFALINPHQTPDSGCMGRPTATRVFMSSLSDLKDMTVGEATRSTGLQRPDRPDAAGIMLFIWVYAPSEDDQAVPATWGNVLANFGKWITDEPCRTN